MEKNSFGKIGDREVSQEADAEMGRQWDGVADLGGEKSDGCKTHEWDRLG